MLRPSTEVSSLYKDAPIHPYYECEKVRPPNRKHLARAAAIMRHYPYAAEDIQPLDEDVCKARIYDIHASLEATQVNSQVRTVDAHCGGKGGGRGRKRARGSPEQARGSQARGSPERGRGLRREGQIFWQASEPGGVHLSALFARQTRARWTQ